ncbi:T7SS effector LXG polymorphic toxin, partial [Streptococcus suis]|uniref:T7SS effector LXG polymorphic toxin n=1 Tax=Streptococcus suis TaxID=1307 RepID=UPI001FC9DB71
AMSGFINDPNLQGQAVTSIRTYLSEVHGTFLQTLINLMNDYSASLLLYKDGYYNIDSNNHAELPENTFTTLQSDLKTSRDHLKSQIELLNTARSKISDLVSYSGSSHTKTIQHYNFIINDIKTLDESIKQYESNHASHDLSAFKELLASTKALLMEYSNRPRVVATYQSGDIGRLTNIERFATAYQAVEQHLTNNAERLQAAQERDQARFEALAAEERNKQGWIDLALGAVTIAVGLAAIVATAGAATPLVVGAGIVAGTGTVAYGASNVTEAGQDIYLGYKGDGKTLAINPIRDTLFMGNDKLYHQVGGLFTTTSAVMIPIGQTQSVTKGLAEFAIGEVGGFVGGQAGYHGTKLLGGSEADAERATFVGSILGGFAASSAASKFSLNDVVAPKTTLFMDEMSPEDAHRYAAWNDLREAGIDQKVINEIILTNKGLRPNPRTYLSPEYMNRHLSQFDDGISIIQTDFAYSRFTESNGFVGVPDDNTLFVLPKKYADEIALQSEGDLTVWEEALGFKKGYFSNSGGLVKIDVTDVDDLNLRIPDGNEFGANELWQPGGRTYPGYTLEAVTDVIPNELTTVTRLE